MPTTIRFSVSAGILLGLAGVVVSCGLEGNGAKAEEDAIVGRWLRPDGGYILEVQAIDEEGRLEARYLNPRPIRVASARLLSRKRPIRFHVEFQDEGYPGSYYELALDSEADMLHGIYYQAVQGAVYDVYFTRLEEPSNP